MAGVAGFEPTECRSQSPVPYRLAIPQLIKTMGWIMRLELTASRVTIWRSNQLSYIHHTNLMARPTGFEPVAYCLEGSCSIQLSYGRI